MVGWAREEGRRTSRHPDTAWNPPASPSPPSAPRQHLLVHPSTPKPARMRKGIPKAGWGDAKSGAQPRAPQRQPGGDCARPALPRAAGDSHLASGTRRAGVYTASPSSFHLL